MKSLLRIKLNYCFSVQFFEKMKSLYVVHSHLGTNRDVNQKLDISLATGFLIFYHFRQGNYIKITKCKTKLIDIFVKSKYLQKYSSNGQIGNPKKPYITRFKWALNLNFFEGQ